MAKRLRVKHKKMSKDIKRAYDANKAPWDHKVATIRSKKALAKKANRMV